MKTNKGFTLIELMIVTAIVGILAAIIFPQFGEFKKRSLEHKAGKQTTKIKVDKQKEIVYDASKIINGFIIKVNDKIIDINKKLEDDKNSKEERVVKETKNIEPNVKPKIKVRDIRQESRERNNN